MVSFLHPMSGDDCYKSKRSCLVLYMLGSSTGGSKVTDEVYMEVVVGGEEPVTHDRSYDSVSLSKDFMPVAWAVAYGQHPCLLNCF